MSNSRQAIDLMLDFRCSKQMMIVAAMLSVENVFRHGHHSFGQHHNMEDVNSRAFIRKLMQEGLGDHILFLRIYEEWERHNYTKCKRLIHE